MKYSLTNHSDASELEITLERSYFSALISIDFSRITDVNEENKFIEILNAVINYDDEDVPHKILKTKTLTIELDTDASVYFFGGNVSCNMLHCPEMKLLFQEIKNNYLDGFVDEPNKLPVKDFFEISF